MDVMTQDETREITHQRNQWMVVASEKQAIIKHLRQEIADLKRERRQDRDHEQVIERKTEIINAQRRVIMRLRQEIAQKRSEVCADPDLQVAALRFQLVERDEMINGLRQTIEHLKAERDGRD